MNAALRFSFAFFCIAFQPLFAFSEAQPARQADRVIGAVDRRATTLLRGHVPVWVASARDEGATPADTPLRLTFVLSRSPELQTSFAQLLEDQQNPDSPSYHQWLTPQDVGERFGPTQHDVDALTAWLSSQGLTVLESAPSRVFVSVSGTASAVESALGTSFHTFNVNGRDRVSATVDPAIPSAFSAIVMSISGLSDPMIEPMHHVGGVMPMRSATKISSDLSGDLSSDLVAGQPLPELTSSTGSHYIAPGDFATIFDLKQVYNSGVNGAGQKVAIIGRSRVLASDVSSYESLAGLTTNLPNMIVPPTGVDPGVVTNGDEDEAILDVERVIGTAPGVQADLIVSGNSDGGIFTAAQYEVQSVVDPVMTISFGACEANAGPSSVNVWDTLFSQAASEGISVFVSAGDSAAAGCDTQFAAPPAYQFLSINYLCSSSYATCVGGTELVEGANAAQYWSSTNTNFSSALSYIPEGAWNEPVGDSTTPFVASGGGGGASIYVAKPSWQTGTGVPADKARDVPDMSFPSAGHDGYFVCDSQVVNCATGYFAVFAGTSAAAPSMAGVAALLNQKMSGAQGNLNPMLYRIAASSPSAFHDATPASSGVAGCSVQVASICNNSTPSAMSLIGGLAGYALTVGYDQATGLGSLDVANFLTAAAATSKSTLAATTLAVQVSAATITDAQSVTFTSVLTSKTAGTPTGTVQFYADDGAVGDSVSVVSGKAVSAPIPFPSAGSYLISAVYSGDATFAGTTSPGVQLTVTGLPSLTKVAVSNANIPVGTSQGFTVSVSPNSGFGVPTGTVRVTISGPNFSTTMTAPLSNGAVTTPAITFPTIGSYTVTASYGGDSSFSPSNSASLSVIVQRLASTVALITNGNEIGAAGGKIYIATISSTTVGSTITTPTGTIQLYANGAPIGTVIAVTSVIVNFPFVAFPTAGTYNVTAVYAGDPSYWLPSTSNGVSLTVDTTPASYKPTVSSPTLSIAAGSTSGNTDLVTVPGSLGYGGTVFLACSIAYNGTGSATSPPTCAFTSSNVSVSPSQPVPMTLLTINTTAARDVRAFGTKSKEVPRRGGRRGEVTAALCALLILMVPLRRTPWRALAVLLVFGAGFNMLSGCSSGGGSSTLTSTPTPTPTPPAPSTGTTAGSYTVSITATSNSPGVANPAPVTIALTVN
jgi:pseudomonalisin